MKLVVRLGDGGSVVIVSVVIAAAPLIRLNGDAGLKAQVDPAMKEVLQVSTTLLEILLSGVTVSDVDPVCPAGIARLGAAVVILKSGIFTVTNT